MAVQKFGPNETVAHMKILLTNDDGYFAGGIQSLAAELADRAEVFIVAPATEQSGVSQAITFLRPLNPYAVKNEDGELLGYTVNGTPADCVKLGLHELSPFKPDLVISGINNGLNIGINTCHSGTVGGAFAASMFDVPSIAISVQSSEAPRFDNVASMAWPLIEKLAAAEFPDRTVCNLNFPQSVAERNELGEIKTVPVETNPLGYHFLTGEDPKNNPFFWATNSPGPKASPFLTDVQAVLQGYVTMSMLAYDPNHAQSQQALSELFSAKSATEL